MTAANVTMNIIKATLLGRSVPPRTLRAMALLTSLSATLLLLGGALSTGCTHASSARLQGEDWKGAHPALAVAQGAQSNNIKLILYYQNGVTAKSADREPPSILLTDTMCSLHLLIQNISHREIVLWRPHCPEGDACVTFQFKHSELSSEVKTAQMDLDGYIGPNSVPGAVRLAPGEDVIYDVNFCRDWRFPIALKPGEYKRVLMRAVYRSKSVSSDVVREVSALVGSIPEEWKRVWVGEASSAWDEVALFAVPGTSRNR